MTEDTPKHVLVRLALLVVIFVCPSVHAGLDLSAAAVERLDNGLTLIVLEEPALPVVSVQMLYTVGALHEETGKTGLAHFLEHMAFRASENFPDTGLVSEIYAVGGEWHGYTWLDQTTYFATVPKEHLDLLLRIEADRMARLDIDPDMIEPEKGAVLTEMHSYENDPGTVLQDYLLYTVFLAHPYRNNTIGWEADIESVTHEDAVDFYRRHYRPANAILAVVGDVRAEDVSKRVRELFGPMESAPPSLPPHTGEPVQTGERRIQVSLPGARAQFKMAWRAPSVRHPDFPAFLLLQELLSGGSGVSFLQNDWGTPTAPGRALYGVTADLNTWYPPMGDDFVFIVSGSVDGTLEQPGVERDIEARMRVLREALSGDGAGALLADAQAAINKALVFDVQTTEDAAHQLAYFAGLGAMDVLLELPARLEQVDPVQVVQVLDTWLDPRRRTVGWMLPGEAGQGAAASVQVASRPKPRSHGPVEGESGQMSRIAVLTNGLPVVLQRAHLSPTAHLRIVADGHLDAPGAMLGEPAWGLTAFDTAFLAADFDEALDAARAALDAARPAPGGPSDSDPAAVAQAEILRLLGLPESAVAEHVLPRLLVLAGDIPSHELSIAALDARFGGFKTPPDRAQSAQLRPVSGSHERRLARPVAQEHLAWVTRAPGWAEPEAAAWQVLLYILSHGYEGRLGKEAISRRGLVYYIDSEYHGDAGAGWITLDIGVDPVRFDAMRDLLAAELQRLKDEPPTEAEVDEAKRHLLGRNLSAAQSNAEQVARHSRDWVRFGHAFDAEGVSAVTRAQVLGVLESFTAGATIAVRNPEPAGTQH